MGQPRPSTPERSKASIERRVARDDRESRRDEPGDILKVDPMSGDDVVGDARYLGDARWD